VSKRAHSPLEMIDSCNVDRRSNGEPELGPAQELAGFFDLLDGDSHFSTLIIDVDAPPDPNMSLDHIALPGFKDGRGVHFPMMDTPISHDFTGRDLAAWQAPAIAEDGS
jgi:hypothetical protein